MRTKHLPAGILSTQTKAKACCNMLKKPACRYFGHIVHLISHVATGSKHLPAGISGTSNTLYRALQHAQNTCLQVYRTHRVPYTACCIVLKTPACRYIGHIVHLISHAATDPKHLPAGLLESRYVPTVKNYSKNRWKFNPLKKCDSFFATVTRVRQRERKNVCRQVFRSQELDPKFFVTKWGQLQNVCLQAFLTKSPQKKTAGITHLQIK